MTRRREDLDETIDRVAASMTFAPADPTLARRVAARIASPSRLVITWPQAAAVSAVVALVLAVVSFERESGDRIASGGQHQVARRVASSTIAAGQQTPSLLVHASPNAAPVRQHQRSASRIDRLPAIPQIPALESPMLLQVPNLPSEPLSIAAVDLPPLDVGALRVAAMTVSDDEKE